MITMIVLLFYYIHNGLVHLCGENSEIWDFPGSLVVKNPPSSAGDTDSIASLGRPPQAAEQLSLHATITQAQAP